MNLLKNLNMNEIENSKNIFFEAGANLKKWYNDNEINKLIDKKHNKYVADILTHQFIEKELTKIFPNIPIISEENYSKNTTRSPIYWIIDPIDGTLSWANGYDGYVTQAALIIEDMPRFSIVYCPVLEKLYHSFEKDLLYVNNKKIIRKNENLNVLVDNTNEPHGVAQHVVESLKVVKYIESGSLGLKCSLVAEGIADIFIKDVPVRDWDIAPAWLFLKNTSCKITKFNGEKYFFKNSFEKKGIIVTSSEQLHHDVCSSIENYNC